MHRIWNTCRSPARIAAALNDKYETLLDQSGRLYPAVYMFHDFMHGLTAATLASRSADTPIVWARPDYRSWTFNMRDLPIWGYDSMLFGPWTEEWERKVSPAQQAADDVAARHAGSALSAAEMDAISEVIEGKQYVEHLPWLKGQDNQPSDSASCCDARDALKFAAYGLLFTSLLPLIITLGISGTSNVGVESCLCLALISHALCPVRSVAGFGDSGRWLIGVVLGQVSVRDSAGPLLPTGAVSEAARRQSVGVRGGVFGVSSVLDSGTEGHAVCM